MVFNINKFSYFYDLIPKMAAFFTIEERKILCFFQ